MFTVRIEFLSGRYVAADVASGNSKTHAEWPPHPARLQYALVDAWAAVGKSEAGLQALRWLEQHPATLTCSKASGARVSVFVPPNDPFGDTAVKAGGDFPFRTRKGRAFASSIPYASSIYLSWAASPSNDVTDALKALLALVPRLGHSTSLVHAQVVDGSPKPDGVWQRWEPDPDGEHILRVAAPGRTQVLLDAFAVAEATSRGLDKKKRPIDIPVAMPRPDYGPTARYTIFNGASTATAPARPSPEWVVVTVDGPALDVTDAQGICDLYRRAVLAKHAELAAQPDVRAIYGLADSGEAPWITGHAPGSTPDAPKRAEAPHLRFLALPFIGSEHADGHVLGLAVLLPPGLARASQRYTYRLLGSITTLAHRPNTPEARTWALTRVTEAEVPWALRPARWTRAAHVWASVTPYVLDRMIRHRQADRGSLATPEVYAIIERACAVEGLPKPDDIWIGPTSGATGVPPSRSFPRWLSGHNQPQRHHTHVVLYWQAQVSGPVTIGAGRFGGYGLFAPSDDKRWLEFFGHAATEPEALADAADYADPDVEAPADADHEEADDEQETEND